jgi:carbonic anhydrase
MHQFRDGVRNFRNHVFPTKQALFRRLSKSQAPKALFLTCADSRIIPNLITSTTPGELFVERNPGNIVPIYSDDLVGVSASIEYAATVLQVPEIIICGHSDCGAVRAFLNPDKTGNIPAVARWLLYGDEAVRRLHEFYPSLSGEDALPILTQLNVEVQIENLLTHPSVRRRVERGDLDVYGWVYDIATGSILAMDSQTKRFEEWPD